MTIFETERLTIRGWTADDAEDGLAIYGDPQVLQYLGGNREPLKTLEQMRERVAAWKDRDAGLPVALGFWAIERAADGVVVGSVILRPLPNDTRIEVGWHLGRKFWGSGYATEAGAGAIRHGFDAAGLEEIFAIVQPENEASIRVTRRLGMTPLGTTTKYHDLELLLFRKARIE